MTEHPGVAQAWAIFSSREKVVTMLPEASLATLTAEGYVSGRSLHRDVLLLLAFVSRCGMFVIQNP